MLDIVGHIHEHNAKALFRTGQALFGLKEYDVIDPSNRMKIPLLEMSAKDGLAGNKDDIKDLKIVYREEDINLSKITKVP